MEKLQNTLANVMHSKPIISPRTFAASAIYYIIDFNILLSLY
ncbi:hypothetical protein [Chryseobacterium sp.]|nr:hypothetical protein [Chryseobacterium sp.]